MDVNRVIGEVAARHGVRLDPDDPALVLVTVAEIMLAEAREEFLRSAREVTAEFVEASRGVAPPTTLRQSGSPPSREGETPTFLWAFRGFGKRLVYGALAFASGFVLGRL